MSNEYFTINGNLTKDTIFNLQYNINSFGFIWSVFISCDNGKIITYATPVSDDFNISGIGIFGYDGIQKIVSITPKENKSTGAISIFYNTSTTVPSMAGMYKHFQYLQWQPYYVGCNIMYDNATLAGNSAHDGGGVGVCDFTTPRFRINEVMRHWG